MNMLAPAVVHAPAADVLDWVETTLGITDITVSYPELPGRARDIWLIDGRRADGSPVSFVVRHESGAGPWSGTSFTLAREGAVLRALENTPVPTPAVLGVSDDGNTLAIAKLAGTARLDFADEAERRSTIDSFLRALVALHDVDYGKFDLPFGVPQTPADHALLDIADYRRSYDRCEQFAVMDEAYAWLAANAPTHTTRTALVQGDSGPGNFLHEGGSITGLVDWEAAHVGDPMDDLAWLWFRKCFLRRDTDLGYWYARYEALSGRAIDLDLVRYYRVAVVTRVATSSLTKQAHESVYDKPKLDMILGLVRAALRDPFGTAADPEALAPLAIDPSAF